MSITVIPSDDSAFTNAFVQGAGLTMAHQESQMRQKASATEIALKQMQMQFDEASMPVRLQGMQAALELTQSQIMAAKQAMAHADKKLDPQINLINEQVRASRAGTGIANRQLDLEGRKITSSEKATDAGIRQGDKKLALEEQNASFLERQATIDNMLKSVTLGMKQEEAAQAKQFFELQTLGVVKQQLADADPEMLKVYSSMETKTPALKLLKDLAAAKMKGEDFLLSEEVNQQFRSNPQLRQELISRRVADVFSGVLPKDQLAASLGLLNAPIDVDGNIVLPDEVKQAFSFLSPKFQEEIKQHIKDRQTNPNGTKTSVGVDLGQTLARLGAPKAQTVEQIRSKLETPLPSVVTWLEADKASEAVPSMDRYVLGEAHPKVQKSLDLLEKANYEVDLLHPQNAVRQESWKKLNFSSTEAKQKVDGYLKSAKAANPGNEALVDEIIKDPKRRWAPLKELTFSQKAFYNQVIHTALMEPNKRTLFTALKSMNLDSKLPPAAVMQIYDLEELLSK